MPRGLTEYVQAAGRGGRDGHQAYAVLLLKTPCKSKKRKSDTFWNTLGNPEDYDLLAMEQYACHDGCRRKFIGEYFDASAMVEVQRGE